MCKSTFQDTFRLGRGELDVLQEKSKHEVDSTKEKRDGRYNIKYTSAQRDLIEKFINLLPRDIGHYGREGSEKEYLSCDLNYQNLHQKFSRQNPEVFVKVDFFICVFKTEFPNLSFHKPRVDTCNTCDKLSAKLKGSRAGSKDELLARGDC